MQPTPSACVHLALRISFIFPFTLTVTMILIASRTASCEPIQPHLTTFVNCREPVHCLNPPCTITIILHLGNLSIAKPLDHVIYFCQALRYSSRTSDPNACTCYTASCTDSCEPSHAQCYATSPKPCSSYHRHAYGHSFSQWRLSLVLSLRNVTGRRQRHASRCCLSLPNSCSLVCISLFNARIWSCVY